MSGLRQQVDEMKLGVKQYGEQEEELNDMRHTLEVQRDHAANRHKEVRRGCWGVGEGAVRGEEEEKKEVRPAIEVQRNQAANRHKAVQREGSFTIYENYLIKRKLYINS